MNYRKYKPGEQIVSLDELYEQEFIFCRAKLYHHGWFESWPLRDCQKYLYMGYLRKAVKQEANNPPKVEAQRKAVRK